MNLSALLKSKQVYIVFLKKLNVKADRFTG